MTLLRRHWPAFFCLALATAVPAGASNARIEGRSQVLPRISGQAPLSRLPGTTRMGAVVVLQVRNQPELDSLIVAQQDPHSPEFMHYLTPDEFGKRFGAPEADYQAVVDYLKSTGLQITQTFPNRLCINVEGTSRQMEQAFALQMNRYRFDGRTVFANDRTPSLPAALNARLLSVEGLTDAFQMRPMDGTTYPNYHTPVTINKMYGYNGLRTAGFDGTGQTIAIYSLADYNNTNLATYASQILPGFASPPQSVTFNTAHVVRINVDNGDGTSGTTAYSEEADLDTQLCLGSVPGATIQIWLAKNGTMGGYNLYLQFANQTAVKIMTSSWGLREDVYIPSYTGTLDAYHTLFSQAASEGLNIFNSTGDDGSRPRPTLTLDVSHPASDPYVVAIGGTTLTTGSGDVYGGEIGWGGTDTTKTPNVVFGSGGGLSTYFARPSWQAGPGVINSHSNGKRQLPDISMDADPNTGYIVRMTSGSTTGWYIGGGTSASAPEWACGTLLLEQAIGKAFFLPPMLYQVFQNVNGGSPFHDMTGGNNGDYPCTAGYDYVTGIGSADFGLLLAPLKGLVNTLHGDINLDGKVDMNDAVLGLQIVGGLTKATAQQVTNGDVLGSGRIDLPDVVAIVKGL